MFTFTIFNDINHNFKLIKLKINKIIRKIIGIMKPKLWLECKNSKECIWNTLIQLFQSNWNNKINMNKNGNLYTSCVIVATNILYNLGNSVDYHYMLEYRMEGMLKHVMAKHSLLVGTSRENVRWTPY